MIPGSHFVASAQNQGVNEAVMAPGLVTPSLQGWLNLQINTGISSPLLAGYQGLADLSDGGQTIRLVTGSYQIQDMGAVNSTMIAEGDNETLIGGAGNDLLQISGSHDVAIGGAGDDTITVTGSHDLVEAGAGNQSLAIVGFDDTVKAGSGSDTIDLHGDNDFLSLTKGSATVTVYGSDDTVSAGAGDSMISLMGQNTTIVEGGIGPHHDTVVGFTEGRDTVHLSDDTPGAVLASAELVNGGRDTQVTLADGSTLLFKGATHIDPHFFS